MDNNDKDNKHDSMLELKEIYNSNSDLFQYYKAINKQIQRVISLTEYNLEALKSIISQINEALPALSVLKQTIDTIVIENKLTDEYKEKITAKIAYIKEKMSINEIDTAIGQIGTILREQEENLLVEKRRKDEIIENEKIEKERREQEEKKRKINERIAREEKINKLKISIQKIKYTINELERKSIANKHSHLVILQNRLREKQEELDALVGNNKPNNSNKPNETLPKSTLNKDNGGFPEWLIGIACIASVAVAVLIIIYWKFILISLGIVVIIIIIATIFDK